MALMRARRSRTRSETDAPESSGMSSPLFLSLAEQLAGVERCNVLDLGPALGANIGFFSQLHCRLHIQDCIPALARIGAEAAEDGPSVEAQVQACVALEDDAPFDLILCWDVLNYLERPVFQALMRHLAPRIAGQTYLHAYIGARGDMPALPSVYQIGEDGMQVRRRSEASRPCPCYHLLELRQLMPVLGVSRSILLRNGVQEYLFKGEGRGPRRRRG